jgi:hypothetical protein
MPQPTLYSALATNAYRHSAIRNATYLGALPPGTCLIDGARVAQC